MGRRHASFVVPLSLHSRRLSESLHDTLVVVRRLSTRKLDSRQMASFYFLFALETDFLFEVDTPLRSTRAQELRYEQHAKNGFQFVSLDPK